MAGEAGQEPPGCVVNNTENSTAASEPSHPGLHGFGEERKSDPGRPVRVTHL